MVNLIDRDELLKEYGLDIETFSPEPFFEQTLLLASNICNSPVAYISIIGNEYQYILSQHGIQLQVIKKEETICQYTIQGDDLLVIPDTRLDTRTSTLKITQGDQPILFYAGFPLTDDNDNKLGAFCITDQEKRTLTDSQRESLKILGKQVVHYLQNRRLMVGLINKQGKKVSNITNTTENLIHQVEGITLDLKSRNNHLKEINELIKRQKEELLHITNIFPGSVAKINTNYQYVFSNDIYEEWTGLKNEDIYLNDISEVLGETLFLKLKPLYERVFKGETIHVEGTFNFKNSKRYLKVAYIPSHFNGNIDGAYVLTQDLTEVKAYQSKLEQSNEQLLNFASIVSHDLKAPLRTISSFAQLLEKDLDNQGLNYKKDYLKYIIQSGSQLNQLTSDLLDFAKVDNHNISKSDIPLIQVLETVEINLHELINKEKAVINYNIKDETVHGHFSDFLLLFQNFISNAIKYRRNDVNPIIDIQLKRVKNQIEFRIKDNGIGIPKEKFDDILLPFRRVDNNSKVEGTGIGLATCNKIIQKYHSNISIESSVGKGSTFIFTIPSHCC